MPPREVRLETADATYFHFKSDIFNRLVTYSTDKNMAVNLVTIPAERVFEVIELNKAGEKPLTLAPEEGNKKVRTRSDFGDVLSDEDDLSRFDRKKKKRRKNNKKPGVEDRKAPAAEAPTGEAKTPKDTRPQQSQQSQQRKPKHKPKKRPANDKGNEGTPQS